mmetsp:Transcript_4353/g.9694  ORF Transcript_4353/g.9694 Transcript_4353/m.9694 type:complete len:80 (+) Transcript_4353:2360-2599(+)
MTIRTSSRAPPPHAAPPLVRPTPLASQHPHLLPHIVTQHLLLDEQGDPSQYRPGVQINGEIEYQESQSDGGAEGLNVGG